MPGQVLTSVENNFTKGLVTEFTGLNFPENAATSSNNTEYTLIGDVVRREGIDIEVNGTTMAVNRAGCAINTYKWNNAGGDGLTQVVVEQVGATLYFYVSSNATDANPLSRQLLASTINISNFLALGNTLALDQECQFSDGNGYLFVYHTQCDPFYCTYVGGVITGAPITLQVRDFAGIFEAIPNNVRPTTLNAEHNYNLLNQGWTNNNTSWTATSGSSVTVTTGTLSFSVSSGLVVSLGDAVTLQNNIPATPGGIYYPAGTTIMTGVVTGYVGTTLTLFINYANPGFVGSFIGGGGFWNIFPTNIHGYINAWVATTGNYPSNSDVWWSFKDSSGVFNPATTLNNTDVGGAAPKGSFLFNPFRQTRTAVSGVAGLTDITTTHRPSNGCWFQGRVWYTGINDTFPATGDAIYTTWTENIYFSQIVQTAADFGKCYQINDPTDENLFDLLPTDGGVIQIQGSGNIYKLFPLMNALLVFAANGVWYISGSQGIGFSASDYSIVKLSSVRSISRTSYVDINGLPIFWNEEGIYQVEPAKQGQGLLNSPLHVNPLEVNPLTIGTILTFYNSIPLISKQHVKGAYDPIEYVVQWVYKSTPETSVTDRYTYDSILNYNTSNKAFFPYTVDTSLSAINGILYVAGPGGTNVPQGMNKYVTANDGHMSWADEHDTTYVDWAVGNVTGGVNYISTFTTGFKLHGQAERKFQVPYIYVYSRLTDQPDEYYIQSNWDYAISGNSGRWSAQQKIINTAQGNFGMVFRRHRLRGQGLVAQIQITSVDGTPFDIMGWAMYETQNVGV